MSFSSPIPFPNSGAQNNDINGIDAVKAAMKFRIAIVQASAGWGKTTAIREAVGEKKHIWLEISAAPRESGAFLFSLAHALNIPTTALGRVLADSRSLNSVQPAIDWLSAHHPVLDLLIVDDLHLLVEDHLSLDIIVSLVKIAPHIRWVFASRFAVSLPISTWMAYGDASLPVVEDELFLNKSELRNLLINSSVRSDDTFVDSLLKVTGGWPVAVQFFLRAAERSADLSQIINATREVAFSFLADHAIQGISEDNLRLLRMCSFGSCEVSLLNNLGRINANSDFQWLRSASIPLVRTVDGLKIHDLFSEYIRRTTPVEIRSSLVHEVIDAFLKSGRIGDAIDAARSYAPNRIFEIISAHGFTLLDEGRWETISQSIQVMASEVRQKDPGIIGIRAALEAFSGSFDRAESLYQRAIEYSLDLEQRSFFVRRLSLIQLNRANSQVEKTLVPYLDLGTERSRCEVRSIYAVALAMAGNFSVAISELEAARRAAEDIADDYLVAKISMRSAWAFFHSGDYISSERYAMESSRIAESLGDWGTYSDAQSMLCASMCFHQDDSSQALWHAQQITVGSSRSGNRQMRLYGLWAQYDIEVDRGRRDRVEVLERELEGDPYSYRDASFGRIAQAIRLGWDGFFEESIRKLLPLEGIIVNQSESRYWRSCLSLFYAFLGDSVNAQKHINLSGRRGSVKSVPDKVHEDMADLYLALSEVFIGRSSLASRRLPPTFIRSQDKSLSQAVKFLASLTSLSYLSGEPAILILKNAERDGLAYLLESALKKLPDDSNVFSLSDAEMLVLTQLGLGRNVKQIASTLERSYETIRTQLKSIYKKLGVSSQLEAITLAKRLKIIE